MIATVISDTTQLILAVGVIINAVIAFIIWWRLHPMAKEQETIKDKVVELEKATNGKEHELQDMKEKQGIQAGRLEESHAAAIGTTTVGTPAVVEVVSSTVRARIIAEYEAERAGSQVITPPGKL